MNKKFLGGFAIGIGCMAFVSVDNKYVGAFLFSVGLLTICGRGWELFTGKLCGDASPKELALTWILNAAGICLAALIYMGFGKNTEVCRSIIAAKSSAAPLSMFLSAICCEVCIYIAVVGYRKIPSDVSKNLSIVLGVMVFILGGFEHCVADMFYACFGGIPGLILIAFATAGNICGAIALKKLDV